MPSPAIDRRRYKAAGLSERGYMRLSVCLWVCASVCVSLYFTFVNRLLFDLCMNMWTKIGYWYLVVLSLFYCSSHVFIAFVFLVFTLLAMCTFFMFYMRFRILMKIILLIYVSPERRILIELVTIITLNFEPPTFENAARIFKSWNKNATPRRLSYVLAKFGEVGSTHPRESSVNLEATPENCTRKRAKSSITQMWIIRFRSNFVQSLNAW